MEEEPKEIECKLEISIEVEDGDIKQQSFIYEKRGLNESKTYTSLRFISSEDVSGIP